ncbi:hypothetical protein [Sphingomonas glaciei]|uniref:Uncharacterized protein n=1 Tax=Sphingomonas glaciei TaxID=2938948 RepID=A0ABY5MVA8_9SPHN|nr:hypothetical protein [Sphingomonas glaciei]UUR08047.1 hypothetical protein M1K48_14165 [Sphingomonas glaciei]
MSRNFRSNRAKYENVVRAVRACNPDFVIVDMELRAGESCKNGSNEDLLRLEGQLKSLGVVQLRVDARSHKPANTPFTDDDALPNGKKPSAIQMLLYWPIFSSRAKGIYYFDRDQAIDRRRLSDQGFTPLALPNWYIREHR